MGCSLGVAVLLCTWAVNSLHRAALRKQRITTAWHKSARSWRTQQVQADRTDGVSVYRQPLQSLLLNSYCTHDIHQHSRDAKCPPELPPHRSSSLPHGRQRQSADRLSLTEESGAKPNAYGSNLSVVMKIMTILQIFWAKASHWTQNYWRFFVFCKNKQINQLLKWDKKIISRINT